MTSLQHKDSSLENNPIKGAQFCMLLSTLTNKLKDSSMSWYQQILRSKEELRVQF